MTRLPRPSSYALYTLQDKSQHLADAFPLTITDQVIQAREGRIRALYIIGEDPMRSDPNINHVKQALEKLDFLVVQEIFMNKTAEFADVILPGASFAEKDGTFTNSERRVQRIRKAIEPLGNSRPDWKIVCESCGALHRLSELYVNAQ